MAHQSWLALLTMAMCAQYMRISSTIEESVDSKSEITWEVTLTLTGVSINNGQISGTPGKPVAWSDPPDRKTMYINASLIVNLFGAGKTYETDHPNAVLSIGSEFAIVQILGCVGDERHMSFSYSDVGNINSAIQAFGASSTASVTLTLDGKDLPTTSDKIRDSLWTIITDMYSRMLHLRSKSDVVTWW